MASPKTLASQATQGNYTVHRLMPLRELKPEMSRDVTAGVAKPTDLAWGHGAGLRYFDDGSVRWAKTKKTRAERKAERRALRTS